MIIKKAVILAGGRGSRAKKGTYYNSVSKVMFRINNKPILQKNIDGLIGILSFKMSEDAFTVIKKSTNEGRAEEFPNYSDPLLQITKLPNV